MKFSTVRGVLPSMLAVAALTPTANEAAENSGAEIEEVLVTATRLPRAAEDIAGTVSVISEADIQRQLANDLGDVVQFQPGVSMETARRGGNEGFVIRGIGGNRVLTIIDGVRSNDLYQAGPASYGKDAFEPDDLLAVEIIRGPASVLYGADAMGGAVILRTKDPKDYLGAESQALRIQSSASSVNDEYKGGLSYAMQSGNFGAVVQYTRREFAEQEIKGPGQLNPQDGNADNWMVKSVWQSGASHEFSLTLDSSHEVIDTRLENDLSSTVTSSNGTDSTRRKRISLAHQWTLASLLADKIETQLNWQQSDGRQVTDQLLTSYSFIDPRNPASFSGVSARRHSDFGFDQETAGLSVMLTRSFGDTVRQSMVYGLHVEQTDTVRPRDRCDTATGSGATTCAIAGYPLAPPEEFPNKTFPDTETERAGVYWQSEIVVGDSGLTVIPGLRFDQYKMTPRIDALLDGSGYIEEYGGYPVSTVDEEAMSLNLGLIYDVNDSLSAFAQYAEGYRPPNFDESNQAFVNLGHGYATVPNPDLKPEESEGIEIGLRASFPQSDFSLAVYHNDYANFISSEMVGTEDGILLFQDRNVGNATIYGAEATASWKLGERWRLNTSLAWSRGQDKNADVALDTVEPLTSVTGLRYEGPNQRWGVESLLTLTASKDRVSDESLATTDGYEVVDVLGHFDITPEATLRFGVFNLFDSSYTRWNSLRGLAASDEENIAKAQSPGRNLRLGISYQF